MATLAETRTAPFATIEEAIEDIRNGKFVVVVRRARPRERGRPDDRGRAGDARRCELHGDARAWPDLPLPHGGPLRRARPARRSRRAGSRGTGRRTRTRSMRARASPPASLRQIARTRSMRAIDPTAGPHDFIEGGHVQPLRARAGGVLAARRPDRGGRRSRTARRASAGRRRLRDHERRRDDGARPRSRRLLRAARPEARHRRRPHRVPPPHGEARRARELGAAADRVRRVHAPSPSARP